MAEGEPRPGAEVGAEKRIGDGLAREVRQAFAVLDSVTQELPSADDVFAEIKSSPTYNRELFRNWRNAAELDEALQVEIARMRAGLVEKHEAVKGTFSEPTGRTKPPPNPYA